VQKENAHEAESFLKYWRDLFLCYGGEQWYDEIMFKRLSVDGGGKGQAEVDALYQETILNKGISKQEFDGCSVQVWEQRPWQEDDQNQGDRTACPALWMTPVIRQDGELMICCADLQGEFSLGNTRERSFLELWNGRKMQTLRREHLRGHFSGLCQECGGINWYSLPKQDQNVIIVPTES